VSVFRLIFSDWTGTLSHPTASRLSGIVDFKVDRRIDFISLDIKSHLSAIAQQLFDIFFEILQFFHFQLIYIPVCRSLSLSLFLFLFRGISSTFDRQFFFSSFHFLSANMKIKLKFDHVKI
jgi:hypothetical protein